jgi:hypothetical protein
MFLHLVSMYEGMACVSAASSAYVLLALVSMNEGMVYVCCV